MYIGGATAGGIPTALGTAGVFDGTRDGQVDGVIAKFNADGARIWSGYFGGPGNESILSIAVANDTTVIVGGFTTSSSSIAVGTPITTFGGGPEDGFVATILPNGNSITWSQYVGGPLTDRVVDVGVTSTGLIYAGGVTQSPVGISTAGSYQPGKLGGPDNSPFIRKYNAAGTLLWGTYYNVSAQGNVRYAVDAGGDIFFGGNIPVGSSYPYNWSTGGTHQIAPTPTTFSTPYDIALARFSGTGARIWGTYYGNSGNEILYDFSTRNNLLYLTGYAEGTSAGIASACPPFLSGSSGGPIGNIARAFVSKFTGAGLLGWGTYLPGFTTTPYAAGPDGTGNVYVGGSGGDASFITPGAHDPGPPGAGSSGTFLIKLDDGLLPDSFKVSTSVISPLSQTACILGWAQLIIGNVVTQTGPIGYSTPIFYQWQQATSPTGPWTDIVGQVFKDYQPQPTNVTMYYRRLILAFNGCAKKAVDSSAVAVVNINSNSAPIANSGGGAYLICPGLSVTLGGSPSATGGTPPYAYAWWAGAVVGSPFSTSAAPSTGPIFVGTTFTLRVTDANGCIDFDQTSFTPVTYSAGPDVSYCIGGPGAQLGTTPEPTTTFNWTPATGISCTNCANPIATPSVTTTYIVTQTVPTKGGTCTVMDTVIVTPVSPPNNNPLFAGVDKTICRGATTSIGTPADPTFFYSWSPTTYLGATAFSAVAAFAPGGNIQPPCPMIYTLSAYKGTCIFTDQVSVFTINPDLDNYGPVCGPLWVNGAGPTSCTGTSYAWSLVSGSGTILSLSGGGANALLKNNGPGQAAFQRTSTLNSVTCTKQVILDDSCATNCSVGITVISPQGCPKVFPGLPLQLAVSVNPLIYNIHWSPSTLVNDSTAPVVTVLTSSPTTFTVKITNKFDPSDTCSASILVNKPTDTLPVFNAPNVSTCPNVGVSIGLSPLSGYSYLWATSPALSCLSCSNPVATTPSTSTYKITVTDTATGCKGTDSVLVTVVNIIANAGPDQIVCNGSTVTIGTPDPSSGQWDYSWQPALSPWQSGTNQFSAQPQVLYSSIVPLTFTLTVIDSASGCQAFDTVVLKSTITPGAIAGNAVTICPGDTVTIGTAPKPGYTYSWSPATGLSCTNCAQPLAYPSTTTTYVVSAIAAGCSFPLMDTIVATVSSTPVFSFINKTICPGTGAGIGVGATGNPSSIPGVVSWSWAPGSYLSCTGCPNPIASPPTTTTYVVTATNADGCKRKDTVVVTPSIAVSAGADKNICPGDSVLLGLPVVSGVTYSWSPAAGLSCTNCAQPMASPGSTTMYKLTATNGSCTVVDSVFVAVASMSPMTLGTAPPLCSGNCTTIGFFGTSGYSYQWAPITGIASPTNPMTVVCPTSTTTYTLVQTDNSTGCSNLATITISILGTAPTATSSNDTICAGSLVTLALSVSPAGSYSYTWTPASGLNSPFIANPIASPTSTTAYTVTVTNNSTGCSDTANSTVVVLDPQDCNAVDWGDLPAVYEGSLPASHGIDTSLHIGPVLDGEPLNAPAILGATPVGDDVASLDDEDGVGTFPLVTTVSNYYALPVLAYNNSGSNALLTAWVDWNKDGDFADPGEACSTVTLNSAPTLATPLLIWSSFNGGGQVVGGLTYLRMRLHPGSITPSPNGAMTTGEVEDYTVVIPGEDFGDVSPTPLATASVNPDENANGAPDAVGSVWAGAIVDYKEFTSISNASANGDDLNGALDDEDGVTIATPSGTGTGSPFNVTVNVSSVGAVSTQVGVWIDFNGDGDFVDAIDFFQMPVVASTGSGFTPTTVSAPIPLGGSANGAIVRVGITPAAAPNFTKTQAFGPLSILNGEWEDNIYSVSVPLPLHTLSFSAKAIIGDALLDWIAEGEDAISAYEPARSVDGATWKVLGRLTARASNGLQHYSFIDNEPKPGINYYRLGLLSKDGSNGGYSPVVKLHFEADVVSYAVRGGAGKIHLQSAVMPVDYSVYAANGVLIRRGHFQKEIDVSVPVAGVYLVQLLSTEGTVVWMEKVVVR